MHLARHRRTPPSRSPLPSPLLAPSNSIPPALAPSPSPPLFPALAAAQIAHSSFIPIPRCSANTAGYRSSSSSPFTSSDSSSSPTSSCSPMSSPLLAASPLCFAGSLASLISTPASASAPPPPPAASSTPSRLPPAHHHRYTAQRQRYEGDPDDGPGSPEDGDLTCAALLLMRLSHSASGDSRRRRLRTSPEQLDLLEQVFQTNSMPNQQTRALLASELGMSPRRVQIWFQNKRAKVRRAKAKHEQLLLLQNGDSFAMQQPPLLMQQREDLALPPFSLSKASGGESSDGGSSTSDFSLSSLSLSPAGLTPGGSGAVTTSGQPSPAQENRAEVGSQL
eukprot:TRINITY_DN13_c1_g1_i1.p1 TRINITY_DN13_c1_g1~~TRINITY_DN13_c1_g1_i1.p1  ORF type:complete len:336 (+),score=80.07 TRINITY_DN13_c1_g1_i1:223-1230(+)